MPDIVHRIGIKSPITRVYQAIASLDGLAGWWTEEVLGDSRGGGEITFRFRTPTGDLLGEMRMQVRTLDAPAAVSWEVVGGPPDWIGTTISFDLSEADGQTILIFGHRDWQQASESMAHCSMKWATFLLSLRALVETGKGLPSPHDLKIDNWN